MTNQPNNEPTDVETSAQPGNNPVASMPGERTQLSAEDLAPNGPPVNEVLREYGDDETTNDRVRTNLGRELQADHLERLNVNTQAGGHVYLRGPVHSHEESDRLEQIARQTEGVTDVVNELHIEQDLGS